MGIGISLFFPSFCNQCPDFMSKDANGVLSVMYEFVDALEEDLEIRDVIKR